MKLIENLSARPMILPLPRLVATKSDGGGRGAEGRGEGAAVVLFKRALVMLLTVALILISSALVAGENTQTNKVAAVTKKPEKIPPKKLSGAELYAIHCNRCHPERYAPERTAEQWQTILLHMRTRANLPAEHARAILKYLQEDSGR
jgi:hypothetical protein